MLAGSKTVGLDRHFGLRLVLPSIPTTAILVTGQNQQMLTLPGWLLHP